VRLFFRELYSTVELDTLDIIEMEKKGDEHDMANGKSRSDKDHSNILSPSPIKNNTICDEKIKGENQGLNANGKVRVTTGMK
jgi:hypothetical protein